MDKSRRDLLALGLAATAGSLIRCSPTSASRSPSPAVPQPAAEMTLPPPVPLERYAARRNQVADRMKQEGIDALLLTPCPSLFYLTGANLWRSERLIASVLLRDGTWKNLGPAFEAERLKASGLPGDLRTWQEDQSPVPLLAELLAAAGAAPKLAVEGSTWFEDLAPLSRLLPSARLLSATPLLSAFRMRKDPEEIALIQAGANLTLRVMKRLMEEIQEGVTESQVLSRAESLAKEQGVSLEGLVQFGANSAIPHGDAGDTRLKDGDAVLFDMGVVVHGYHSDVTRTFAFGRPRERYQQVYGVVKEAQETGIRAARAGASAASVDEAARSVIRKAGFGHAFTHRLGHGLGLEGHEHPYLVAGNLALLQEGTTVTIEPGIYLTGEFGIRLEDDVRVAVAGAEVLSTALPS